MFRLTSTPASLPIVVEQPPRLRPRRVTAPPQPQPPLPNPRLRRVELVVRGFLFLLAVDGVGKRTQTIAIGSVPVLILRTLLRNVR